MGGRGQKRDRGDEGGDGDARQDRGRGETLLGRCPGGELGAGSYINHRQNSACHVRSSCHPNAVKVVACVKLAFSRSGGQAREGRASRRKKRGSLAIEGRAVAAFSPFVPHHLFSHYRGRGQKWTVSKSGVLLSQLVPHLHLSPLLRVLHQPGSRVSNALSPFFFLFFFLTTMYDIHSKSPRSNFRIWPTHT